MDTSASKENHDAFSPPTTIYNSKKLYWEKTIAGHFDTDSVLDYASLFVPVDPNDTVNSQKMFCCNPCITSVVFSNGIPGFKHGNDLGWIFENLGDLDGDGIDEIVYARGWFIGVWAYCGIFTFKQNEWNCIGCVVYPVYGMKFDHWRIKRINDSTLLTIGDHHTYGPGLVRKEIYFPLVKDTLKWPAN